MNRRNFLKVTTATGAFFLKDDIFHENATALEDVLIGEL